MSETYGIEAHEPHAGGPRRAPARYLVIVDATDQATALLYSAARERLEEFQAGVEEVAVMVRGLIPERSGADPAWDEALGNYSAAERAGAEVYTLDL